MQIFLKIVRITAKYAAGKISRSVRSDGFFLDNATLIMI